MPRYIDADLLWDKISRAYLFSDRRGTMGYVKQCINDAPTADVQEVRHDGMDISQNESYWDATDCGSPACNRCGKSPLYYAKVAHVRWDLRHLPKFCSNCGATMKEVLYSDKSGKVQKLQIP